MLHEQRSIGPRAGLHQHRAFRTLPIAGSLGVTDELAPTTLRLPFHTRMRADDIDRVVAALAS